METLHWNPAWRAGIGSTATLDGGADARFTLDGVDPAELTSLLQALGTNGTIEPRHLAAELTPVLNLLVGAGALTGVAATPAAAIEVTAAGPGSRQFAAELANRLRDVPGDLTVVVRSGDRLEDLNAAIQPDGPHLLIDAAYRHRIVIGPLVLPGLTACLRCYAGRIAHRWGDPLPPTAPAASQRVGLIAELVTLEIERVASGTAGLANACIVFDTNELTTSREAVFKLPWCPACGTGQTPEPDKDLAW